jgi:hypothetical protein
MNNFNMGCWVPVTNSQKSMTTSFGNFFQELFWAAKGFKLQGFFLNSIRKLTKSLEKLYAERNFFHHRLDVASKRQFVLEQSQGIKMTVEVCALCWVAGTGYIVNFTPSWGLKEVFQLTHSKSLSFG